MLSSVSPCCQPWESWAIFGSWRLQQLLNNENSGFDCSSCMHKAFLAVELHLHLMHVRWTCFHFQILNLPSTRYMWDFSGDIFTVDVLRILRQKPEIAAETLSVGWLTVWCFRDALFGSAWCHIEILFTTV